MQKNRSKEKCQKTNTRFEFLDPDYPSVNPYSKHFFRKKSGPLFKKIDPKKNVKKLTPDSNSSTPITLRSTLITNIFFVKKVVLCVKKRSKEKCQKTNTRFEFLDPDYPSVNPYNKHFFLKKSGPLFKKIDPKKNVKKLTPDSNSSTPITLRSTLIANIFFVKKVVLCVKKRSKKKF